MSEKYNVPQVSYCGADIVSTLGGSPLGQVQSVQFSERFGPPSLDVFGEFNRVTGVVEITMFGGEPDIRRAIRVHGANAPFILEYENEYGQALKVEFVGSRFTHREVSNDVDDVMFTELYHFEADDVKYFDERSGTINVRKVSDLP